MEYRTESDFIGSLQVPVEAIYGINAARARLNFPDSTPFHFEWYKALGYVKHACYLTVKSFNQAVEAKYNMHDLPLRSSDSGVLEALLSVSESVMDGAGFDAFIVPAISGGAGTSINMNMNEILANLALLKLGYKPGQYEIIDPTEDANIFQSTNDVVPTALRVAVMFLLQDLEQAINKLRASFEILEQRHRNDLRVAYTQMQEAVPSSYGKLFSNYSDALSRDWWRVSKCFERIKVVNLGGSAIGTSLAVPRFFVMEVVQQLQQLTGLPVTRGENLTDTTSNLDAFVEIHGILKALAVTLEKTVSDLRLLAADVSAEGGISIPQQQVGSSIMPGKVNPVIPEFVISASHQVYAADVLITGLCAQGCLDLNAYLPSIGHTLISSLKALIAACNTMNVNLVQGISVDATQSLNRLLHSPAITTALIPQVGYHKAAEVAKFMKQTGKSIVEANHHLNLISDEILNELLKPSRLLKGGFSLSDL